MSLGELKDLLSPLTTRRGKVLAVDKGYMSVSTDRGIMTFPTTSSTFVVGDDVLIKDGNVYRMRLPASSGTFYV